MKLIFIIIIIILIYYVFLIDCGCNKENFVDLDTFKKIIFGKKLDIIQEKIMESRKIVKFKEDPSSHKQQLKNLLKKDNTPIDSYDDEGSSIIKSFTNLFDIFPQNTLLDKKGRLEITKISLICVPIKMDLTSSYNNILNNNDIINYDINKPEENKALIFNTKYNLIKISWEKSLLNWYNQTIDLEFRVTFRNPDNGKFIYIIFPLVFKRIKQRENFQDGYYNLDETKFKTSYSRAKDSVSSSMKSGVMYPVLQNNNIIFNDVKRKLDNKTLSANLHDSNTNLKNDMNFGIISDILDNSKLVKNVILQPVQSESEGNKIDYQKLLSGINLDKLDLSSISNDLDLNYVKDYLTTINFNNTVKSINNVKYTIKEATSLLYLDYLVIDPTLIPSYICCSPTSNYNQYVVVDLEELQTKILNQNKFYCTTALDGSITYITQPYPFNENMGNHIYNNLINTLKLF